jgi:hypothetical protein
MFVTSCIAACIDIRPGAGVQSSQEEEVGGRHRIGMRNVESVRDSLRTKMYSGVWTSEVYTWLTAITFSCWILGPLVGS